MKVLVTGSSLGIGRAIAQKFVDEGHEVHGIDIVAPAFEIEGVTTYIADVADYMKLPQIWDVEVLINNAGVQNPSKDLIVNLQGVINCTEVYGMRQKIKSVVNIASASAHTGAEFGTYVASKGGVLAYTKFTAREIAGYGATCNSISPGAVLTGMNNHILKSPYMSVAVTNESMLKKWATPEEVADLAYFLAVINKSITGQDILIDNGEMLNQNFIW